MLYKLPANGFNKFSLHRGKRKATIQIVPGQSLELEPSDLAELRKIGIVPTLETSKPRKRRIVLPAPTPTLPVEIISEPEPETLDDDFELEDENDDE